MSQDTATEKNQALTRVSVRIEFLDVAAGREVRMDCLPMERARVSIQFNCREQECDCNVVVRADLFQRTRGATAIYEYSGVTSSCPKCGHRLFGRHSSQHDTEQQIRSVPE